MCARLPRLSMLKMHNAEFNLPRLAEIYEVFSRWGKAAQFFLDLANETPNSRILDLGCGTGQITLKLAEAGHQVTGLDPALASLEVAQQKAGAERVRWIHGLAADAPTGEYDLALMTNHVAQFLIGDTEWMTTLLDLRRALRPGGRLIFDSRDPAARSWESWVPEDREEATLASGGTVQNWTEVQDISGELLTFVQHYDFSDTPGEVLSRSTLRFRREDSIRKTLKTVGFHIEAIYGGWNREPVGQGDGEFIVLAQAR